MTDTLNIGSFQITATPEDELYIKYISPKDSSIVELMHFSPKLNEPLVIQTDPMKRKQLSTNKFNIGVDPIYQGVALGLVKNNNIKYCAMYQTDSYPNCN